jgi:tRNA threonylcarbamoyladenosine modification (KEOPS) complex  Pcc1 subunit
MPSPNLTATLSRTCLSEEMASALRQSLHPDNGTYVKVTQEKERLTIVVEANGLGEMQRSLDDLLACMGAAERTWVKASGFPESDRSAHKSD